MKQKPSAVSSKVLVALDKNTLTIKSESIKIITFKTEQDAKAEFKRMTASYRGCPRGTQKIYKTPQITTRKGPIVITPTRKRYEQ